MIGFIRQYIIIIWIDVLKGIKDSYEVCEIYGELEKKEPYHTDLYIGANTEILKTSLLLEHNGDSSLENENAKLLHDIIKKTPTEQVLSIMKRVVDAGNFYYITVFIAVFTQFPIFGYLYCLNDKHNNNQVYQSIKGKMDSILDYASQINNDWKDVYKDYPKEIR